MTIRKKLVNKPATGSVRSSAHDPNTEEGQARPLYSQLFDRDDDTATSASVSPSLRRTTTTQLRDKTIETSSTVTVSARQGARPDRTQSSTHHANDAEQPFSAFEDRFAEHETRQAQKKEKRAVERRREGEGVASKKNTRRPQW